MNQNIQRFGLLHQPGQPPQQGDVFIGLGGDSHHQMRFLTLVPFNPVAQLQNGNAGVMDQMAVFDHPVRNGDPAAEKGVRHLFALKQAVNVAGINVTGVGEHLPGEADRFVLAVGVSIQSDAGFSNRFHIFLQMVICDLSQEKCNRLHNEGQENCWEAKRMKAYAKRHRPNLWRVPGSNQINTIFKEIGNAG